MLNKLSEIAQWIKTSFNNFPFFKIKEDTNSAVNTILDTTQEAANDNNFRKIEENPEIINTIDLDNNLENQDSNNIEWGFSWYKRLIYKGHKFWLTIENWVITKAIKKIHGKVTHLNAKNIRTITKLIQNSSYSNYLKTSTSKNPDISKKSSKIQAKPTIEKPKLDWTKKHNDATVTVAKKEKILIQQNEFNTRLDGQYNFINNSKTQFTIIVNKWEIKRTYYKSTTTIPSQEEIDLIQSSINSTIQWLSDHKNMRTVKKELLKEKKSREIIQEVSHKSVKENVDIPNLNGNKKHDDYEELKYKNKLREEARQQEEKNKIIRWSFIKQDLQLLSKHQFMLSKTDKIWNIEYIRQRKDKNWNITNTFDFNQQQAVLLEVFTTLWARKWIYNLRDIKKFINTPSKLHIFKGQILSYLEWSIPEEIEDDRNALLNIFNNAIEVNLQHKHKDIIIWTLIDASSWETSEYTK